MVERANKWRRGINRITYPSNFDHCSTIPSRCYGIGHCWEPTESQSEKNASSVDETQLASTRYLRGTNQRKVQTQRVKMALELSTISIKKHMDVRVTRKPGDGGWIRSSVIMDSLH